VFKSETALSSQLPTNLFDCDRTDPAAYLSIDEVGRGCLAGPVFVCVSLWVPENQENLKKPLKPKLWLSSVRDSKKLTPQARKFCFDEILSEFKLSAKDIPIAEKEDIKNPDELCSSHSTIRFGSEEFLKIKKSLTKKSMASYQCVSFCLGVATADEVDQFNIWNAVQLAAARALLFLKNKLGPDVLNRAVILMDGKLFIKVPPFFQNHIQAAVVQADDLFVSVGFSSIVAKVCRDQFMERQDFVYPHYGFFSHKGYGTKEHFENIRKYGICSLHRKTFLK
jgi:ribonuclease HII